MPATPTPYVLPTGTPPCLSTSSDSAYSPRPQSQAHFTQRSTGSPSSTAFRALIQYLPCWARHWYYPHLQTKKSRCTSSPTTELTRREGYLGLCFLAHALTGLWVLGFGLKGVLQSFWAARRAAGTFVLASSRSTCFSSAAYLLFRLSILFKQQTLVSAPI